jgi:hypothetical protein
LLIWNLSPKTRSARPAGRRSGASGSPSKQLAVGQVSTVWPMRSVSRFPRLSLSIVKKSTDTPGRASGVSAGASSRSIAASHLQAITDVAKPVSFSAASLAHRSVRAVMISRAARIPNASAKVSSM